MALSQRLALVGRSSCAYIAPRIAPHRRLVRLSGAVVADLISKFWRAIRSDANSNVVGRRCRGHVRTGEQRRSAQPRQMRASSSLIAGRGSPGAPRGRRASGGDAGDCRTQSRSVDAAAHLFASFRAPQTHELHEKRVSQWPIQWRALG